MEDMARQRGMVVKINGKTKCKIKRRWKGNNKIRHRRRADGNLIHDSAYVVIRRL
jgi:hypothetical protein